MTRRRILKAGRGRVATVIAAVAGLLAAGAPGAIALTGSGGTPGQWSMAGQNTDDTHFQAAEHEISPASVGRLAPRWTLTTAGAISATPTVDDGAVYVPDYGGKLWAAAAGSGRVLWSRDISSYTGVAGDQSGRTLEKRAQVEEGVKPDLGGGHGAVEVDQVGGRFGLSIPLLGQLVVVKIDDGRPARQFGSKAEEVGEVEGFAAEDEIDGPDLISRQMFCEPCGGDEQTPLHASGGKGEDFPAMSTAAGDGFEHGATTTAMKRFDREYVELLMHGRD